MTTPISDTELKALVDSEVRASMGELTGDLSSERARAMDYYLGENAGNLRQEDPDRSRVVMTTVRDTVEWLMPQLMRMFAQADAVVEFEAVGDDDEEAAKQETQAINHIFWRQNEGFLILYQWFKDALLQKNGIIKWWLDESETRSKEEYDGLTLMGLEQMQADEEIEAIQAEQSDIQSVDGSPLFHVVFERKKKKTTIVVENVPPEEFLISSDARSLALNDKQAPRFVGHLTEKSVTELREMGFSDAEVDEMIRGADRWWDEYDQEDVARYHLSDEDPTAVGQHEGHESQRKIHLVEAYMAVDKNGDGYAELIKVLRAGDFIQVEEADTRPFAALTPVILSHKFFGMSVAELMEDLQEIGTSVMRNVLDNMYQTNNVRPICNDRVDVDSLLTTRPGAPVYIDDSLPVGDSITFQAPPALWKDGLTILEYLDGIRKDRTGVGDETEGLDPNTLANANTGVMMQAMEAARAKIELIARIFAETGLKWAFRGFHELARKSYDQELRIKLRGQYVSVNPQEWRERDDITVNVGTATGNAQREIHALTKIGEAQLAMVQAGGLGVTVLPSQLYETAKSMAEALGEKNGDKFFFNPMQRQDPQVMQMIQAQMPPPPPDPNMAMIEATAKVEGDKVAQQAKKAELEALIKKAELDLKREEMGLKAQVEKIATQVSVIQSQTKNRTDIDKAEMAAASKAIDSDIKRLQTEMDARQAAQQALIDQYRAELQSFTQLEVKRMELMEKEYQSVQQAQKTATRTRRAVKPKADG